MLAYMPYMDTMGFDSCRFSVEVYILTELITGGELHGAIREIPTVLSRCGWWSSFMAGTVVGRMGEVPSGYVKIAIENHHF